MRKPAFTLQSSETATDYWIFVEEEKTSPRPPSYAGAVLFMDGDDMFAAAAAAYRKQRAANAVPPLLIVGVGYGGGFGKPANKRGRDYTPVAHHYEPASGGADAFLRFLTTTLWPELDRRYSLAGATRGVAGHSLGSLLVLHALFQPKPFFSHFLASAPSVWWADRAILTQADKLQAQQAGLPARLFLCIGEQDSESSLDDLRVLEQQLAAKPFRGLEVSVQRIPDRNHYNVLPEAFAAGLGALFGPG
ncbi:MAG TPA: alpha/beta hydrolase-fold protein [Candidatus Didemnitutus sp.]|nr:alpha/beta hydrolase-fold protein [Candidatus Didemnitutus sp.]